MYVEASKGKQGEKARLCSKEFQGPMEKRFTFKYHPFVESSTKLIVLLKNSTGEEKVLWSLNTFGRNEWLSAALSFSNSVNFAVILGPFPMF